MKLIIKQYLSSLKEREELDSVLPSLLSQLGLNVFSRPQKGTRQDGVDVGAVGSLNGEPERVYLFSIKAGDLTRSTWDGDGLQSLRPSLNEILDSYIPHRLPQEHKGKNIVVCICIGGDVQEQVRPVLEGYIKQHTHHNLSFEEWNGDRLANLIASSFLREDLLPKDAQPELRKALALLDEPEASYHHFAALIKSLIANKGSKTEQQIMLLRQINICLWILFSWARDANNLESVYLSSELGLLYAWEITKDYAAKKTKDAKIILDAFQSILAVCLQISNQYIKKMIPLITVRHSLSVAVHASSDLDVNLKLFDVLGRLSMAGIWNLWMAQGAEDAEARDFFFKGVKATASLVNQLIWNNPILLLPTLDHQAIDISVAVLLLMAHSNNHSQVSQWLSEITERVAFAIQMQGRYPCILSSYSDLLEHPIKNNDDYFKKVTSGSILYPMIALWAALLEDSDLYDRIKSLKLQHLPHCSFQLWFPDETSENSLYVDKAVNHGATLSHVPVDRTMTELLKQIFEECDRAPFFENLSAVKYGYWPIVLVACRHHRLPIPPQIWKPGKAQKNENETSNI